MSAQAPGRKQVLTPGFVLPFKPVKDAKAVVAPPVDKKLRKKKKSKSGKATALVRRNIPSSLGSVLGGGFNV